MDESQGTARAGAPLDDEDLRVLGMLARLTEAHDPVPEGLTERVSFALTVAALEAEVAELTSVSARTAGVRGDMELADTVSFSGSDLTAMITISVAPDGHRLIHGWTSVAPVEVELRSPSGTSVTRTDPEGRFSFEVQGPCLVHLVLRRDDGSHTRPLVTPPIEV